jgi:hypothetical protein
LDKPFKQFEREAAALIGGKRFPANSGADLDCEGPAAVMQCKLRKRLSLEDLSQLAEHVAAQGRPKGKLGLVAVKVRRGAGHPSQGLVVMTFEVFRLLAARSGATAPNA